MGYDVDEKLAKLNERKRRLFDNIAIIEKETVGDDIERNKFYDEYRDKLDLWYRTKDDCNNIFLDIEFIEEIATKLVAWINVANDNYNMNTFFSKLGLKQDKIEDLKLRSSYFKDCYELALFTQEAKLVSDGLKRNSNINAKQAQFILMNVHNMAYKEDNSNSKNKDSAETIKNLTDMFAGKGII
jgi:hypothetical protein